MQSVLHKYILKGYAIIVLDGLDEIPDLETRSRVVHLVEEFADFHVPTPQNISIFDDQFVVGELDKPSQTGGNQLIITSRIVGYHAQPLSGQFSHYTILPMKTDDMTMFVDHWFQTVHREMITALDLPINTDMMKNVCEEHTAELKKEVEEPKNEGLRQLASNPCLMNFICFISFCEPGAKLPVQRIRLYERLANLMLGLWTTRDKSNDLSTDKKKSIVFCAIQQLIFIKILRAD